MYSPKHIECKYFYRNKSPQYYNDIEVNHENIMEIYMKDDNGDPASPINGKISGLLFTCNMMRYTGEPPIGSPFGKRRLLVPASHLMKSSSTRLYFVDFFCMTRKAHWVTLVMTRDGSQSDQFCRKNLVQLDKSDNHILYERDGIIYVTCWVWVELFYTENIDITSWMKQSKCKMVDVDLSSPTRMGSRLKRSLCSTCNL